MNWWARGLGGCFRSLSVATHCCHYLGRFVFTDLIVSWNPNGAGVVEAANWSMGFGEGSYFGSDGRSSGCGEIGMLVGAGVVAEGFGEVWMEGVRDFDSRRPQTDGVILEEVRDPNNCPLGRLGGELVETLHRLLDPPEGVLL